MIKPLIDVRTFQFKFYRYAETEVINLVGLAEGTHFFIWTLEGTASSWNGRGMEGYFPGEGARHHIFKKQECFPSAGMNSPA